MSSILACGQDLEAAGVIDAERCWDLAGLREHIQSCEKCASVQEAMAAAMGAKGGAAGRGAAKRRGDSAYYRRLAARGAIK